MILSLAALAGALAHVATTGDTGALGSLQQAAIVNLPAVLALGGSVLATIGLTPRWAVPVGWSVLVASLVIALFGELLELPQAVLNASPFTHLPAVPAQELVWTPILVLLGVAGGLAALGLAAFRRRDLVA